jgi:hypothetical protein
MKDEPKTLDSARQLIQKLKADLDAADKKSLQPAAHHVSAATANVSTAAVSEKAEELTLPAITIASLDEAIRGETDYR